MTEPLPAQVPWTLAVDCGGGSIRAVVLDEAYTEYLPPALRYDSIAWVREHPNLVVSRTLSKAYGLAGLRVGFLVAQPPLTELVNRVRQPFNVNLAAQAAGIAALALPYFLVVRRRLPLGEPVH